MEVTEQLLVSDGLEGVYIDAIPGVVCIDGGHGVLHYDGGDRIFSEEIVTEVIGNQLYRLNCIVEVHVPPQQNINFITQTVLIGCIKGNIYTITSIKPCCIEVQNNFSQLALFFN